MPGTGFKLKSLHDIWWSSYILLGIISRDFWDIPASQSGQIEIPYTARDISRWNMAWRAVQICRGKSSGEEGHFTWGIRYEMPLPLYLFRRHQDWPDIADNIDNLPIALGFGVAGLIYGGLHALAWSAHFQSSTEQLMWQISACVVIGGFPILFVLIWVIDNLPDERRLSGWRRYMHDISVILDGLLMLILAVVYILARAYLVIECFINLSELPAGVYDMPNWSAYFPHIV